LGQAAARQCGQVRPGALFFGRGGPGLERRLDGPAGQLPAGRDGGGLDGGEHPAVGRGVGGLLQLPGEQEGQLDEQGLQGRVGVEGAAGHGGSSVGHRQTTHGRGQPPQSITAPNEHGRLPHE